MAAERGFEAALAAAADRTERALERLLPEPRGPAARLAEAMRYAALGGGKRLRAFLVIEAAALMGGAATTADAAAAAVECVHAYSLVHDDLPDMDDDALRRGRPTVHIAFDPATAILAGDALQTRAFEILSDPKTAEDGALRADLVHLLATASGAVGMAGGQMADLLAESAAAGQAPPLDLDAVGELQSLKTGALIVAAARMGGRIGGALVGDPADRALTSFADALGRVFQIKDDLIDHQGDEAAAGKRLRKDAAAGKATFVDLLGVAGAQTLGAQLVAEAEAALDSFGDKAATLRRAAAFSFDRTH